MLYTRKIGENTERSADQKFPEDKWCIEPILRIKKIYNTDHLEEQAEVLFKSPLCRSSINWKPPGQENRI